MKLELHQFPYYPFNEKVRWALAFKGLKHRRINYMPGPHMRSIRKLSGQTTTPVLCMDGDAISGSAGIIEKLERIAHLPALYPAGPAERSEALALQADFDSCLGPNVRRALFSQMVDEGAYFCRMFASGKSLPARLAYRAVYPMAKGLIKKASGITDQASTDQAFEITAKSLDHIAARTAMTGYLVGGRFTVAYLKAASLLAPAVNPPNCDMTRPEPKPKCVTDFLTRWSNHPGAQWVRGIYARHR